MMESKPKTSANESCVNGCSCRNVVTRREFLKVLGAGTASVLTLSNLPIMAGPFTAEDFAHLVPPDKKLNPDWVKSLFARGSRTLYRTGQLNYIGMPIGGICAGQLYLGGDGRLWLWDIFNEMKNGVLARSVSYGGKEIWPGEGANYIKPIEQTHPVDQGFALRIKAQGKTHLRALDQRGWPQISFIGEYPIGFVEYRDPSLPVEVSLEAFSPFIPLNEDDSGLPGTIMRFKVKNTSADKVDLDLAGYLENAVCLTSVKSMYGRRCNRIEHRDGFTALVCSAEPPSKGEPTERPPLIFEDFESGTYEKWEVQGTVFGDKPALADNAGRPEPVLGHQGKFLADSANNPGQQGDAAIGRLISRPFEISRPYISLLVAGSRKPGKTCVNLVVNGKVEYSSTGADSNTLDWQDWGVRELMGKTAQIEIVCAASDSRDRILVDQIEFRDQLRSKTRRLEEQRDFGTMCLALLADNSQTGRSKNVTDLTVDSLPSGPLPESLFAGAALAADSAPDKPFGQKLAGALARSFSLEPGGEKVVTFVVTWHFPKFSLGRVGKGGWYYASRFDSAIKAAEYIAKNYDSFYRETSLWHDTWYDSTLPYWFLDRVMGNTATLATMTCMRQADGRFYAYEGVGCCKGTCGHVWQYAHAMARLFPELERIVRERVDFGLSFHPDTGIIGYRGEYDQDQTTDAQTGYILRTYREHQMSPNDAFLRRVWLRAKKAMQFLIKEDANSDGILEGRQPHTLDMDLYGPSSWLSSLYLAALHAAREMAVEMGDTDFAEECRNIAEIGRRRFVELLWNGEYFIHIPDPKHPDTFAYGNGCEIDQVMGQNWAFQVGLQRLFDADKTKKALQSVWKYNFTPDVGPYRKVFETGRWYAMPGEGGLLICTFPKGGREEVIKPKGFWAELYFNECQSGYEYEAAAGMVWENLLLEGLAVTRTIHDRYHASRRNPWNEVECGDHYSRCMAVYGVFIAACGFEYHGPKGRIGFHPRLTPENFRTPFTGAQGWGTFTQNITQDAQHETIEIKWGSLMLRTLNFTLPAGKTLQSLKVTLNDQPLQAAYTVENNKVLISLAADAILKVKDRIKVTMS